MLAQAPTTEPTSPVAPTVNYTATDPLGSPRVLTNKQGEVISRRDFMPFGEEIAPGAETHRTAADKYGVGDGVRQQFTGYERDEETGLDFAEARYYYNNHGRFTAVDPLLASGKSANPQTFNRYAYTMNRPLVFVDPTGLQAGGTDDMTYCRGNGDCNTRVERSTNIASGNSGPLIDLSVQSESPVQTQVSAGSVVLGTTIVARTLLATPAATTGALSASGAGIICSTLLCAGLILDRIHRYTPGGLYDNTVNRPRIIDGLPVVSTIGSSNTQAGDPALAVPIPTTATDTTPPPPSGPTNRGRIQIQGGGVEISAPWAQTTPPTKAQGLAGLNGLWNSLSPSQQRDRSQAFIRAQTFINNCPATGCSAPISRSYSNRPNSPIRIDIEIITGTAFVN